MKYLIFMKNYKGDEYKVVPKVLKELRDTLKDFITIHFPGYMSKTKDNIDDFKTHFFEPENKHYFFLKGMNGDVKLISSEKTIQNYHNEDSYYKKIKGIKKTKEEIDHSKIIFYLCKNDIEKDSNVFNYLNYKCKAILIGSSNQSFLTYFKYPIVKGEADILLLDGEIINEQELSALFSKEQNKDYFWKRTIITKEIIEKESSNDILDDIYINTISELIKHENNL